MNLLTPSILIIKAETNLSKFKNIFSLGWSKYFNFIHSIVLITKYFRFVSLVILMLISIDLSAQKKSNYELFCDTARTYLNESNYEISIKYYTKAIQLNPKLGDSYKYRGMAKIYNQDTVGACLDFLKSTKLGYKDEWNIETDFKTYCYCENGQINPKLKNNSSFKVQKYSPLEFNEARIYPNEIGEPVLRINIHNNSTKTIDAFRCKVQCLNRFDEPVKDPFSRSNQAYITDQETIRPGEDGGGLNSFVFHFQGQTTKIKIILVKVHFTDGTFWVPKPGQIISTIANTPF
ncbi:MAG: hypothetical protein ACOYMA_21930 [Bacteroidia bacterium]